MIFKEENNILGKAGVCRILKRDGSSDFCGCSVVSYSVTQWTVAHQASLSFTITQNLLRLMSIESTMPLTHLILCCHRLLLSTILPASVFSNESALCIRWPKYYSLGLVIIMTNTYKSVVIRNSGGDSSGGIDDYNKSSWGY